MKKTTFILMTFIVISSLSACESAEYQDCKQKASKLWSPNEDDSSKQKAYWQAIKRCKEKYG